MNEIGSFNLPRRVDWCWMSTSPNSSTQRCVRPAVAYQLSCLGQRHQIGPHIAQTQMGRQGSLAGNQTFQLHL